MTRPILVTGATGRLGQLLTRRLLDSADRVRVLTRRPDEAHRLFGDQVEVAVGDFGDRESLSKALQDIERLFLLSPISENLARHQAALIDAAADAKVRRIVKISGSDWTIAHAARSIAGSQHRQVEAHLAQSGIPHASLRPNAWMQVSLAPVVAAALKGDDLPSRYSGAPVSFIDANDIADVAARVLHAGATESGALVLTGPKALTPADIASLVSDILRRPVGISTQPAPSSHGGDAFALKAVGEFGALIAEGVAAPVTDTVERILGRRPSSVRQFLARQLSAAVTQAAHERLGEAQWQ